MFNQIREGDNSVKTSHGHSDASQRLQVSMEDMQAFFRNSNHQTKHDSTHSGVQSFVDLDTRNALEGAAPETTKWSKRVDKANRDGVPCHETKQTLHNIGDFMKNPENIYDHALTRTAKRFVGDRQYFGGNAIAPADKPVPKLKNPTDKQMQEILDHIQDPFAGNW